MHLTSGLLSTVPGIDHGFGMIGEEIPARYQSTWKDLRARWKQVHGNSFSEITAVGQECGEVDAVYSRLPGIPIAIMTADCVPILMSRRDGTAAAAIHAGWRGTRSGIIEKLWQHFRSEGERPADWVAAVGPAIGPCCYEVSEELAQDFSDHFAALGGDEGPKLAVPRSRHLDLPAIHAEGLRRLGLSEVELLRACTKCLRSGTLEPDGAERFLLHSYRREGGGTRQFSVISIRG